MRKYFSIFKIQSLLIVALFAMGCENHDEMDNFGLDVVVELQMEADEINTLATGAFAKTPVHIPVRINGEDYSGEVSYAGNTSVDQMKPSYEIILSSHHNGRLQYRMAAMAGDPSALHAATVFHAFAALGFDTPEVKPAALWINDEYMGLYLFLTPYNKTYFEEHNIDVAQLYQAENSSGDFKEDTSLDRGFSVKLGTEGKADLETIRHLLAEENTTKNCDRLGEVVDLNNLFRYMAVSALIDNWDGIDNNYFLYRTQSDSRLQVIPWDLDNTFAEQHSQEDGSIFDENGLFQYLFSGRCGCAYEEQYIQTRNELKAMDLQGFTTEYAAFIEEAYENDTFLSGGSNSVTDHRDEVIAFLDVALDDDLDKENDEEEVGDD